MKLDAHYPKVHIYLYDFKNNIFYNHQANPCRRTIMLVIGIINACNNFSGVANDQAWNFKYTNLTKITPNI